MINGNVIQKGQFLKGESQKDFDKRMCRKIKKYWRGRGVKASVHITHTEPTDSGPVYVCESNINGVDWEGEES